MECKEDTTECKKNGLGGYRWTGGRPGRRNCYKMLGSAVLGHGVTCCLRAGTVMRHQYLCSLGTVCLWKSVHFMTQCLRITSAGAGCMAGI